MKMSVLPLKFRAMHAWRGTTAGNPVDPRADGQSRSIVLMAAWLGLLFGLAQALIPAASHVVLHRYIWYLGPHIIWITPLANLLVFLALGVPFYVAARLWPSVVSVRFAAFVFSFVGFLSLLWASTALQGYAALLLATGLAVQSSRVLTDLFCSAASDLRRSRVPGIGGSYPDRREQPAPAGGTSVGVALSRRQFLVGAGGAGISMAGLTAGTRGWQILAEEDRLARLPLPSASSPNVLLIVLDTVRARSTSLYGYRRPTTPTLERLSASGVCFDRAVSTAPWTLPSHASMFTGRYHHELSANWVTPLDRTFPTLAEAFSAQGYLTAGFAANVFYLSRDSGLDRGFAHYEATLEWPGILVMDSPLGRTLLSHDSLRRAIGYFDDVGRKRADSVSSSFLAWLSQRDERRPFFAFLNYFDAHSPYFPPPPYDGMFGRKVARQNPRLDIPWDWTPTQIEAEMGAYDGAVAYLDDQVGELVEVLARRGILENTLLVVVGDHGEQFGDHGLMSHGNSLYLPSIHVPLLISFPPRVPRGARIREPVTLRDLAATIVDLVELPNGDVFPGHSLAKRWDRARSAGAEQESAVLSEVSRSPFDEGMLGPVTKGSMASLILGQYHYIRNGDGSEELYDVENDPEEIRDLSGEGNSKGLLQKFRAALETALARDGG